MMGFFNGRCVASTAPNQIDYPFSIAAKLVMDSKSCTREEVSKLVTNTQKLYDLCREQDATIRTLEHELRIAESTVRMLQAPDE